MWYDVVEVGAMDFEEAVLETRKIVLALDPLTGKVWGKCSQCGSTDVVVIGIDYVACANCDKPDSDENKEVDPNWLP